MRTRERLSELRRGERATVAGLDPGIGPYERRRLADLGFTRGTRIEVDLVSPFGDPVAYRVRSGVIAIRRELARKIEVEPVREPPKTP